MTTDQIPDLRPLLLRAVDSTDALIHLVGPEQLDDATPCAEFDLRGLLDHLAMVALRLRVVLQGGHFASVPQTTDAPDHELIPLWDARIADLRAALPDIDLSRTVTAPFGTVPAGAALASYVGELAVHAWDLAATLGRADLLDPAVAEPILPAALQRLPREGRETLPFGEVVDVADDAPAYDRLVGWMGRDPGWVSPRA